MIESIPLSKIHPNKEQPRKYFDGEALQELADSIASVGLLNPILVRPNETNFEIVHGERRWRACELAGLTEIRAEVCDLSVVEAFLIAFTENLQRDDLSPIDEAHALKAMIDRFGYTQEGIAKKIGKSQQYVAGRLSLLKLAEPVQELITTRGVSPSIGRELVSIPDERWQITQAKRAAKGDLTVKDLDKAKKIWRAKHSEIEHAEQLEKFFDFYPELACLIDAIEAGQITFAYKGVFDASYLQIESDKRQYKGQHFYWPKYSGQDLLIAPGRWRHDLAGLDEFGELNNTPLFTEEEWQEFHNHDFYYYNASGRNLMMMNPKPFECWGDKIRLPQTGLPGWNLQAEAIYRRTYDPEYGCFLYDKGIKRTNDDPVFVKRGWGSWVIIEFNDGQGHRTRRRFFAHDYINKTFVEEMANTVDPFAFSHHNFAKMNIWKVQPHQMSWWFIRRKTVDKETAIEALEADLEALKNAEPLSDEDFDRQLLDALQNHIEYGLNMSTWREGVQTYPRLDDGSVNAELAERVYKGLQP